MKPILFNTEMVKAILEGRKTVTRRIADINTEITCYDGTTNHDFVWDNFTGGTATGFVCRKCGFGVAPPHSRVPCGTSFFRPRYWPGDILYVRETWTKLYYVDPNGYTHFDQEMIYYAADGCPDITLVDGDGFELDDQRIKWKPSIHMPKDVARIFLRVKRVSVERLQKCGDGWCMGIENEGVKTPQDPILYVSDEAFHAALRAEMKKLWDSTIKPADLPTCGWDANPWVWAYEFERCEKPKEPAYGK